MWRIKNSIVSFGCALVLVLSGCGEPVSTPVKTASWQKTSISALNPKMKDHYERSERARQELAKTLFGRLSKAIASKGPKQAIKVCNVEAQGITKRIGNRMNVAIGRTSFRLRNPKNKPPEWVKKFNLIENRVDEQVVLKKDHRLAVLTPIHLAKKCMTCHGPKELIPPGVRKALKKRYPNDEATGFKQGDLRGWFWVETPKKRRM